ncbi:MAG: hypothetical protein K2O18_17155, partial [Oscillospiraceae bacterium]|nr:hypothetical protein [Oscillospiraceae bacterium]
TVYVVLTAVLSLLVYLPDFTDGLQKLLVYGTAFAACAAGVLIMISLFQLQKYTKINEEAAG